MIYFPRNLADKAWACKPSDNAIDIDILLSSRAVFFETLIKLDLFWKSSTPRGEENLAEPEVGSTWFGPAQ